MRYNLQGCRIVRGASVFITISPDEKHNLLMIRLCRVRRNDPIHLTDKLAARFGRKDSPELVRGDYEATFNIEMDDLPNLIPTLEERRSLLSRHALASVDGFRIIVRLIMKHIFGIRCCSRCPDCNYDSHSIPCMDLFGSNAYAEGGSLGRGDGMYISIEAQKSYGALHAHGQWFQQVPH